MKRRLSETELSARIDRFLTRKYAQFPELTGQATEKPHVQHYWPQLLWTTKMT